MEYTNGDRLVNDPFFTHNCAVNISGDLRLTQIQFAKNLGLADDGMVMWIDSKDFRAFCIPSGRKVNKKLVVTEIDPPNEV